MDHIVIKLNVAEIFANKGKPAPAQPTGSQNRIKKNQIFDDSFSETQNKHTCAHTQTPAYLNHLLLQASFCMKREDVTELT